MYKIFCISSILILMAACTFIRGDLISERDYKIRLVQSSVNSYMAYKKEDKDEWNNTCPKSGDCEDFALCKLRKLQDMGIDRKDLKITIGVTDLKGVATTHAVLVVEDRLVLDNMRIDVVEKDVFERNFHPLYSCHTDSYNVEIHDVNLMISLVKNPEIERLLYKKCESAIIEKLDV